MLKREACLRPEYRRTCFLDGPAFHTISCSQNDCKAMSLGWGDDCHQWAGALDLARMLWQTRFVFCPGNVISGKHQHIFDWDGLI